MPGRIVIVHDDPAFVDQIATALKLGGHRVATFIDPLVALDGLEAAPSVDLLITRVQFPAGKPHGIALALMARRRCPGLKVLFCALPEFQKNAEAFGEFLPTPIAVPDLLDAVDRLLAVS